MLKKDKKDKTVSTKITNKQDDKLAILAEKQGVSKSGLINHLLEVGYKEFTKRKEF